MYLIISKFAFFENSKEFYLVLLFRIKREVPDFMLFSQCNLQWQRVLQAGKPLLFSSWLSLFTLSLSPSLSLRVHLSFFLAPSLCAQRSLSQGSLQQNVKYICTDSFPCVMPGRQWDFRFQFHTTVFPAFWPVHKCLVCSILCSGDCTCVILSTGKLYQQIVNIIFKVI